MAGYISLERTGHKEVDDILQAIEDAGRSFHHTGEWQEDYDFIGGISYLDLINQKIGAAKQVLKALNVEE